MTNSSGASSVAPEVGHFLLFPASHGGGFVTFCTLLKLIPTYIPGWGGSGLLWLVHNLFTAQLCISQLQPRSPGHSGEFNIYPMLKVGPCPRAPEPRSLLKARVVGASEHRNQMKKQFKSASLVSDTLQRLNFTFASIIKNSRFNYIFSLKSSFAAKIGLLIYAS